jgi:hypothetical protein
LTTAAAAGPCCYCCCCCKPRFPALVSPPIRYRQGQKLRSIPQPASMCLGQTDGPRSSLAVSSQGVAPASPSPSPLLFASFWPQMVTPDGYLYGELQRQPALCMSVQSILSYVFFGWMSIYTLICSSACTRKTKSSVRESVSTQGLRLRANLRNIAMHIQHII